MKIRPLSDKILIKREEAENMTKGGIVLPEAAKEKPRRGKVIAVELIRKVREIDGVRGVHVQAIEWESAVPEIVARAELHGTR